MSLLRHAILLALLAAGAAPALRAQTRPDTLPRDSTVRVEGVTVRATRSAGVAGGTSTVRLAPDSLGLGPAPTVAQVLRETPFVRVRENSRGEAELSVRGSESRQVAVLVDGVPLSLGWDNRADLSVLPAAGVQEVRVVRGLASVLHGPNVLGGVVEVDVARSPLAEEEGSLRAALGGDHLGGRAVSGTGRLPLRAGGGDLDLRGGAAYRARPGVALPSGETGALRGNSDLEEASAFLGARYRGEGGEWLSFSASGLRGERGVPPELHLARPRLWRYPYVSQLLAALTAGTGERRTALGAGDLEASLGLDLGGAEIESYADRAYTRLEGRERSDGQTTTLRLLGEHTVGARGDLRAALTLADVLHEEREEEGNPRRYRQRLWSAGSEGVWRAGGARLSAGAALDGADEMRAWGGRVGASTLVGESLLLHAGVSRRARFPSLRELHSGALGKFVPNPGLRPEVLRAGEAGVTARAGGVEAQGVLFHHRLEDVIVRTSAGGGRFRRENRDELRSTGAELLLGWSGRSASLHGDLTLQRVRVVDPATGGEGRAEYQPAVAGGVDLTLALARALRGSAGVRYTGRQWCVHPEERREVALKGAARLDLGVERRWRRVLGALHLENATDAAVYDQCGLPQPGRTLRFTFRLG
jgi:iron complex outermembrane receptor protein